MKIMPRGLETSVGDMILSSFKNDNGFIGSPGIGLLCKELYLPKKRVIEVNGIKYSVDLAYNIEKDYCEDIDEEHKAIIYNSEKDNHANGYNEYFVKIYYNIPNDFLRGYFSYHVKMYGMNSAPTFGLNLHLGEEETKTYQLFLDYEQQTQLKTVFRLNEVNIDCEKFALTINGGEALYKLAAGSLGEIKDCYYQIESGVYNLTLDLDNNTLMIEESDGEALRQARRMVFGYLKYLGFNVYIDKITDEVVFFDNVSKNYRIEDIDYYDDFGIYSIDSLRILNKDGMPYGSTESNDAEDALTMDKNYNNFQIKGEGVGIDVSLKIESLFLELDKILLECTFRHYPELIMEDYYNEPRVENNIVYFDNVLIEDTEIQLTLKHNIDFGAKFFFAIGEGPTITINNTLKIYDYEEVFVYPGNRVNRKC